MKEQRLDYTTSARVVAIEVDGNEDFYTVEALCDVCGAYVYANVRRVPSYRETKCRSCGVILTLLIEETDESVKTCPECSEESDFCLCGYETYNEGCRGCSRALQGACLHGES